MKRPLTGNKTTTRLFTRTDIRDTALLRKAAEALGLRVRSRSEVKVVSPELPGMAVVDLATGVLSAPAEWRPVISQLRKHYAEAKFRAQAAREGVEIRSRIVQPDGSIVLKCRMPAAR